MRVQFRDNENLKSNDLDSQKRGNLSIRQAKIKASTAPQMMLGRALFKKYGIVIPNRSRNKYEQNAPGDEGQ